MDEISTEEKIDPMKHLPLHMQIPSSGKHFYKIGLSNFKNGCQHRSLFFHPILVFVVPVVVMFKCFYAVLTPNRTKQFYLYIGDFGYFMNMRVHLNMTAGLVIWMGVLSQVIHFYNYMIDRRPTYMRVFNMMSGQLTPHSIGLTDENTIKTLLHRSRLAFKGQDLMGRSMIFMAFTISFLSFAMKVSLFELLLIGLPHSLVFALGIQYVMNILCTQLFYFYILAFYLKSKQIEVNNFLRYAISHKDSIKIYNSNRVIRTLNDIYMEISEYDNNCWSKFLGVVWSTCTTVVALVIFMFVFGHNLTFQIRFILFYAIFFYSFLLFLLIWISSSVNFEAETAYKLLASYKLVSINTIQSPVAMARHGFKVC